MRNKQMCGHADKQLRKNVRATSGAVYANRYRKLYLCNSAGSHSMSLNIDTKRILSEESSGSISPSM